MKINKSKLQKFLQEANNVNHNSNNRDGQAKKEIKL